MEVLKILLIIIAHNVLALSAFAIGFAVLGFIVSLRLMRFLNRNNLLKRPLKFNWIKLIYSMLFPTLFILGFGFFGFIIGSKKAVKYDIHKAREQVEQRLLQDTSGILDNSFQSTSFVFEYLDSVAVLVAREKFGVKANGSVENGIAYSVSKLKYILVKSANNEFVPLPRKGRKSINKLMLAIDNDDQELFVESFFNLTEVVFFEPMRIYLNGVLLIGFVVFVLLLALLFTEIWWVWRKNKRLPKPEPQ